MKKIMEEKIIANVVTYMRISDINWENWLR